MLEVFLILLLAISFLVVVRFVVKILKHAKKSTDSEQLVDLLNQAKEADQQMIAKLVEEKNLLTNNVRELKEMINKDRELIISLEDSLKAEKISNFLRKSGFKKSNKPKKVKKPTKKKIKK